MDKWAELERIYDRECMWMYISYAVVVIFSGVLFWMVG